MGFDGLRADLAFGLFQPRSCIDGPSGKRGDARFLSKAMGRSVPDISLKGRLDLSSSLSNH